MATTSQHRRPWGASQDQYLRDHYGRLIVRVMAAELGRSVSAVHRRLAILGLPHTDRFCDFCRKPIPPSTNGRRGHYCNSECYLSLEAAYRENAGHARLRWPKTCRQCGAPLPANAPLNGNLYCGRKCARRAHYERERTQAGHTVGKWTP